MLVRPMTVLLGLLLTGLVFCLASAITGMKRSIFYRMSRVLVAASLLNVAVTGNSQTPNAAHVKHYAIY